MPLNRLLDDLNTINVAGAGYCRLSRFIRR